MIRGTLIRGLNRTKNAKHGSRRPIASFQIRRKGKDSKKPNPRPMYTVRPLRALSIPRGNLRLTRGPPAETLDKCLMFPLRSRVVSLPSRERTDSASLEGSEPTLGGADRLRLARGHPSTERTTSPSAHPPPNGGIKHQPLLHTARVRQRQAAIPHSGCDQSLVRQHQSLLRHFRRWGDTVLTCDAVQNVLGTAPATC